MLETELNDQEPTAGRSGDGGAAPAGVTGAGASDASAAAPSAGADSAAPASPAAESTAAESTAAESTVAAGAAGASTAPASRASASDGDAAAGGPAAGASTAPAGAAGASTAADGDGDAAPTQRRTRRPRRAATRDAGPPPADIDVPPPAVPAVPAAPADQPAPPAPAGGVPQATFQPPPVIFQPPAAGEPADRSRPPVDADSPDDGPDEPGRDGAEGSSRRRRRRGGRSRDHDADGEVTSQDGAGQAADGEASEPAATGGGRRRAAGAKSGDGKQGDAKPGDAKSGDGAAADGGKGAAQADDGDSAEDGADDGADGGSRRRRRRRRRGSAAEGDQPSTDDPPNTVVHVRVPRPHADEPVSSSDVKSVRGSTRLEAKRQRRREGRESGRRRPPVITESEFLARRESVDRVMVVRQQQDRTQIAVLEDQVLVEHYVDKATHQSLVGNVYLGKVQNVLPSMEAAFVDVGKGRNAVLYAGEVNFDASGLEGESKRIESALKSGQSVLVQVTKDPVGHKGARLTSQVSLPGRYLVYVPGGSMMGISRKLPDKERSRLKQILKSVMPEGAGVIVRTAAEGATEEELSRDVARLSAQWQAIEQKSKTANAPELLYSEPDLTIRVVRDIFNEDFASLVVAGDEGWDLVHEYVQYVAPHLADRLTHWSEPGDVFAHYRIDEQLAKALERKVWLPSGGSLVIDNTEAMTVVDVNTGKFTGQGGNLEETVTRNNLEAAEEIVRQLRLRDVGGIIVIDFIDMVLESNRELVLRRLLECLARDRTKHQVAEVTSLGLVQMTRKRVGSGLLEAFSEPCECCNGRGRIISLDLTEAGSGHRGRAADEGRHAGGRPDRNGQSDRGGRQDKNGRRDRNGQHDRGQPDQNGQDAGTDRPAEAEPAGPAAEEQTGGKQGGRRRRRSGGDQARSGGSQPGDSQSGTAVLDQPVLDDPELGDPALGGSGEPAPDDAAAPVDAAPAPADAAPAPSDAAPAPSDAAPAAEPVPDAAASWTAEPRSAVDPVPAPESAPDDDADPAVELTPVVDVVPAPAMDPVPDPAPAPGAEGGQPDPWAGQEPIEPGPQDSGRPEPGGQEPGPDGPGSPESGSYWS
jgi:ribonuclease E